VTVTYNGFDHEVLQLRDEFLNLSAHIAAKYGVRGVSERTVVNLLMEHICEKFIVEKLKFGLGGEDDVDRVWRNLHDYAVALLVERLKNELIDKGFQISITSEAETPTGRYDVLLMVDRRGVQILDGYKNICLEAKTGLNISLGQLEKYLWNGSTTVLVRFTRGDAVPLRAQDWAGFMKAALRDRIGKAKRILEGKAILVPNKDCKECPLIECRFNKNQLEGRRSIGPRDLSELFENFRRNAYASIEAAVKIVAEELNKLLHSGKATLLGEVTALEARP